jgi:hypothetical protein
VAGALVERGEGDVAEGMSSGSEMSSASRRGGEHAGDNLGTSKPKRDISGFPGLALCVKYQCAGTHCKDIGSDDKSDVERSGSELIASKRV